MNQATRITILKTLLLSLLFTAAAAQTKTPKYVDIAFIKSKSSDFITNEKKFWVPVHKQLINEGKKIGWYLYKVKYPTGASTAYDYVRFNVFEKI